MQYKAAIQACNKLLKKHPKSPIVKVGTHLCSLFCYALFYLSALVLTALYLSLYTLRR